ncbi:MAG TPA: biotin transporter BioY [Candidatus Olsenella pullicola]|nr:biotin transporter BioY [Candidatus Olsenella pullicola]
MSNRQIARCGVCIALLAVSAWVTVPLGPVPFTLQTFVLALLPQVMRTRDALFTVVVYLMLGAVGVPVFSGFRGGLGVLLGPTGGYLMGFAAGMPVAGAIAHTNALPRRARGAAGGAALLAVSYVLGTLQLMSVYAIDAPAALAVAVVPFVVPDVAKVALSVGVAERICRALGTAAEQ